MDITVLDIEMVKALHKEVREVEKLLREITLPYKALQQKSKWLDQQEVCLLLGLSKRTLQTYREKGILPSSQIGRKTYFKWSDIEKLMQTKSPVKN
jgi:predicted DNA-binding transcriptional regulator AlpA